MHFNTLAEEQEHLKQCREYRQEEMSDEHEEAHCWVCDEVFKLCDMTYWQFGYNTRQHWHCNKCFKEQVGE